MRRLRVLLLLAALVLALKLWLGRLLEPEAVAARLAVILHAATGLSLHLEDAPGVELLPRLGLRLGPGELRDRDGRGLLRFELIALRLAWLELLERPLELEMLAARGLSIDLAALSRHEFPGRGQPAEPPRLPGVRFPIAIEELHLLDGPGGSLLRLERLTAPPLQENRPWRLRADGEVLVEPSLRFALAATATPRSRPDGIDWEEVEVVLELRPWLRLELAGALRWRAGALSWTLAGNAELGPRLSSLLAAAAGPGEFRSEGEVGADGIEALALLRDAAGTELARLRWAGGDPVDAPLHLLLPRLAVPPVELRGLELKRIQSPR